MADLALSGRLDRLVDTILARGDATAALADPELAPFARLVVEMRHYPNPAFTARPQGPAEREDDDVDCHCAGDSDDDQGPRGVHDDHAVHAARATRGSPTSSSRCSARWKPKPRRRRAACTASCAVGDSMLMVGRERSAKAWCRCGRARITSTSRTWTATFARALAAGGTSMGEPADRPYGERSGYRPGPVRQLLVHRAEPLRRRRCPKGCAPSRRTCTRKGAPAYIEFLKQAFGAVEEARHLDPGGRVMHAQVRIGNAVLELGEPDPPAPMPTTFYLYVDDADALYARAVAAGATPLDAARGSVVRRSGGERVGPDRHGVVHRPAGLAGGPGLRCAGVSGLLQRHHGCGCRSGVVRRTIRSPAAGDAPGRP